MTKLAQTLAVVFALVLGGAGLIAMVSPDSIAEPSEFGVTTDYGTTNLRTLGAPTLALAIITAVAAVKKHWLLLVPAAAYFALNMTARVISVFAEGYESKMLRGLLFTGLLVVLSQIALAIFRRGHSADAL